MKTLPRDKPELLNLLADLREQGQPVDQPSALALAAEVWADADERSDVAQALSDPSAPLGMLRQVMVRGFRGNPLHPRKRDADDKQTARDLLAYCRLFLRIRSDLGELVERPPDGVAGASLHGADGWCDLCGQCCVHGGTVPTPPKGTQYPAYWYHALAGESLYPQAFCPFLYQARDAPLYFCSIHAIKPIACRVFDLKDCERGRPHRGFIT